MAIIDFNTVFKNNSELINKMEKISFVFDLKNNNIKEIINNPKNYTEEDIYEFKKMTKKDFKNLIIDTNQEIRMKNSEILLDIAEYVKFILNEKKHSIESINILTILDIAEKNRFSTFLLIALFFALSNSENDIKYIKDNIMDKYGLNYDDIIYLIYTNNVINKKTTLFVREKIKDVIKRNYMNEKIINALYLCVQNNVLTGEGKEVKFIASIVRSIPNFWKDIKTTEVDHDIITILEVLLKKK